MAYILVLAPQIPYPAQQGTTLRNLNLIAGLAQRGHTIDLAAFDVPGTEVGPLQACCRNIVTAPQPTRTLARRARDTLLHPLPDMALRLESPAMHRQIGALLAAGRYDVLQVEGIEMAPYALALRASNRPWLVFDDHNAEYLLQQRAFLNDLRHPRRWLGAAYSLVQWQKLERYELEVCQTANGVVAVSEPDRLALQRLSPGLHVTVVPNGVDLAAYQPGAVAPQPELQQPALVFTGKMDYRPNVDAVLWFADEVLPLILRDEPSAHFYVVGQKPHARLSALAARPQLTLTGRVPDVRPYMAGATVYVTPLRIGGGTRLKVLEAMAMGLPMVSTRLGCDGFEFVNGREVCFADDAAGFARAVIDLIRDPLGSQRMGQAARAYVSARYGWDAVVPLLEEVYGRLVL